MASFLRGKTRSGFPRRCEACVLNRNPAFRRARINAISGCVSRLCTRRMISDTCSAVRALVFLLRTTPGDDMDMRLKSQPYALVNTIMYRPVASVKPYKFPLDDHGLKDRSSRPRRCILTVCRGWVARLFPVDSFSSRRAYSSGAGFHSLAMVPRERVLRHERSATNAPLRGDDGQFALGFQSANLRKNRRPPARAGRRSALRLLHDLRRKPPAVAENTGDFAKWLVR